MEIVTQGDFTVLPKNRTITVLFRNITEGNVTLLCNGTPLETNEQYENCVSVSFAFDSRKGYQLVVEYREQSELERLKECAKKILTVAEDKNEIKEQLYRQLRACKSKDQFCEIIRNLDIGGAMKMRFAEFLHKSDSSR